MYNKQVGITSVLRERIELKRNGHSGLVRAGLEQVMCGGGRGCQRLEETGQVYRSEGKQGLIDILEEPVALRLLD